MSAPAPATTDVAPRKDWPAILRETAVEVFSSMVGATITSPETNDVPVLAEVTGMVGIAGPLCAVFSLRCSLQSATTIASQMLGVSAEEAAAQKCDAVGEICNMVAGYFKAKIGLGDACKLSVPTVVAGKDYKIRSPGKDERMELPVLYAGQPLWLTLDVRP
ncbi:MAG: chemotaxis protein CheX [Candidatus Sulfotelmatobacter sp.]